MNVASASSANGHEHTIHVLFLGPPNSFSHAAARHVFPQARLQAVVDFPTIFELLEHDDGDDYRAGSQTGSVNGARPNGEETKPYDYAIVPVRNSTNGPVLPVVELLRRCADGQGSLLHELSQNHGISDLNINVDEGTPNAAPLKSLTNTTSAPSQDSKQHVQHYYPSIHLASPYTYALSVHHYLYTHPASAIFEASPPDFEAVPSLHTHPQVWTQCTDFLASHFPASTRHVSHNSTSEAAEFVVRWMPELERKDTGMGGVGVAEAKVVWPLAICSQMAGEASGLRCVAERI
jgi:prephenate dehydratase